MKWRGCYIRIDDGVTVWNWGVSCFLFSGDLFLFASPEQTFNTRLVGFQLHATKRVPKITITKKNKILCLSRHLHQWALKVIVKALEDVEKFKTLQWRFSSIREWRKVEQRRYMDRWSKRSSAWALSPFGHKARDFKYRKAVSFQIRHCSDHYLCSWIFYSDWVTNTCWMRATSSTSGRYGIFATRSNRVTIRDKVNSFEICKSLNVAQLLRKESFQLRCSAMRSEWHRKD